MRRARATGLAIVAALFAAGALVVRSRTDEPVRPRSSAAPATAPTASPPPTAELAAPSIPVRAAAPVTTSPPATAEDSTPTVFRIPGEIHYDDGSVVEDARSIAIGATAGPLFETYYAGIADGKFEFHLTASGPFEVRDVRVGEVAYPVREMPLPPFELNPGVTCSIVLPRPQPAAIVVVDAASGLPLRGAFAVRVEPARSWRRPSAEELAGTRLLSTEDGRIAIATAWEQVNLYISAADHLSLRVSIPPVGGDAVRVPLTPAGSVDLTVNGWSTMHDGVVEATRTPPGDDDYASHWTFTVDREGRAHVDAMEVGAWNITVREGREGAEKIAGTFEVRAGVRTTVLLDVGAVPSPSLVVVTGSVRIPTEWALPRARIVLTGIDEATKGRETTVYVDDLEGGAAREFSVRDVLPGRYAIDVEPTVWRASLTVAGTGARIELDVPRPCVAEIVVHDAATGEEVLKADVDWSAHSSECLRQGTSSHYDATKHAYILRFPPKVAGYVDVEASGFARYDDSASFDLEGTGAEPIRRVIALHRGGKVVVKVRFDGKPFGGAHVALGREMDDVSLDHGSTGTAGEATFSSLSCNTWWVKLDDLPGFVAEEPKKVEVRESQTVEVVFDLRRKR